LLSIELPGAQQIYDVPLRYAEGNGGIFRHQLLHVISPPESE